MHRINVNQALLEFSGKVIHNYLTNFSELNYTKPKLKLKVQSGKSYNNKYMIASTEITNTEILAFIAVLVFSY